MRCSSTNFVRHPLASTSSGYYWLVPKSFSEGFENVLCPVELTATIVFTHGRLIEFRVLSTLPCFDNHKNAVLYDQPSQLFRVNSVEREYEMFANLGNRPPSNPDNSMWFPLGHFVWNAVSWDSTVILNFFVRVPGDKSGDLWPSNEPRLRRTPGSERNRRKSRFGRKVDGAK